MEPTRPPRFLDDPPHICPVLGPRSSRCVRPLRHIGAAPVIVTTKASATITFRGSIARLLCSPPTLRARVAPMLRKDGFWLPASFTRWAWSPTGSFKKVSKCYCPSSPFSKFSLARNDLLCLDHLHQCASGRASAETEHSFWNHSAISFFMTRNSDAAWETPIKVILQVLPYLMTA